MIEEFMDLFERLVVAVEGLVSLPAIDQPVGNSRVEAQPALKKKMFYLKDSSANKETKLLGTSRKSNGKQFIDADKVRARIKNGTSVELVKQPVKMTYWNGKRIVTGPVPRAVAIYVKLSETGEQGWIRMDADTGLRDVEPSGQIHMFDK